MANDPIEYSKRGELRRACEWRIWGGADLFFHPVTKEEFYGRCPFLRKIRKTLMYRCLLHDTGLKPRICREFPPNGEQCHLQLHRQHSKS